MPDGGGPAEWDGEDRLERMRLGLAAELGFALYRQYSEDQAAGYIRISTSNLRRWRRAGKVGRNFIEQPMGGIRYLGLHIANIILNHECEG